MTESEAIKKIRKQICNEKGVQRYCTDNCMYGTEHCAYSVAIQALEEVQAYRAIGTIERFRELTEKAEPKRVDDNYCCPVCHTYAKDDEGVAGEYCPNCGQRLDWE